MLTQYVLRGVKAGTAAGLAFGTFVAVVGNPLVRYAETFEAGGHGGYPVASEVTTGIVSVVGGVLLGILLGAVVFGLVFYFIEPAIPGRGRTKRFLLAAAGFITVSGAPWLVLPPQPPGVTQSLSTEIRITWYLIMMVAGAISCGFSGTVFNRLRPRYGRSLAVLGASIPFVLVATVAVVSPENPVSGSIPGGLVDMFRAVTVAGQVGLWFVLAGVHAWLHQREQDGESANDDRQIVDGNLG